MTNFLGANLGDRLVGIVHTFDRHGHSWESRVDLVNSNPCARPKSFPIPESGRATPATLLDTFPTHKHRLLRLLLSLSHQRDRFSGFVSRMALRSRQQDHHNIILNIRNLHMVLVEACQNIATFCSCRQFGGQFQPGAGRLHYLHHRRGGRRQDPQEGRPWHHAS
jgi:hypothetical protein